MATWNRLLPQVGTFCLLLLLLGCNQKHGVEAFSGPKFDATLCNPLIGEWEDSNHIRFKLNAGGTGEGYNRLPMIWSCDATTLHIKEPNEEGWDDHPGNKYQFVLSGDKLILDKQFHSSTEFQKK